MRFNKLQRLIVLVISAATFGGCNQPGTKSPSATPSPTLAPAHDISGTIQTPSGPVVDAKVLLVRFDDEECAKLSQKQTGSASETDKKRLNDCRKEVATIKSDDQGQYKFSNPGGGWYQLGFGWTATFDSNLINGADFTGEYRTFFGQKGPKTYGIAAVGRPFYFSGTETVVKNLYYNKEPYKSAKK